MMTGNERIFSTTELTNLLRQTRAHPIDSPKGNFLKICRQDFRLPDGRIQTREFIDKPPASVVVPLTQEGNLVFVIQPVALSEEGALIEFPAGYWDFREDGEEAGLRELQEETGYAASDIIYVGSHYQDPGSIRTPVSVYLAKGCLKVSDQRLGEDEYIKVIEASPSLALKWSDEGQFRDANTYIAFAKVARVMGW